MLGIPSESREGRPHSCRWQCAAQHDGMNRRVASADC
jgi:hypothetical protein